MMARNSERGASLVLVLLLVIVLSITVAAGFAASAQSGEPTVPSGPRRPRSPSPRAASSSSWRARPPSPDLSATFSYTLPGGTAAVTLYRVKNDAIAESRVYAVMSVGRNSAGSRSDNRTAVSERAIVQLVKRQQATLDIDAAFTSLRPQQERHFGHGERCGSVRWTGRDDAGHVVPDGTYTPPNGSPNANNYIDGVPDNAPQYMGPPSPGSSAPGTANGAVDIDWASIVDGSAMNPDFHVNRSVSPATGAFPPSYVNWPVLRVTGNLTNGDNFNGQGILIVTGNADCSNITWRGVVLVGGQADLSGSATRIFGSAVTGLNLKLSPLSAYPFLPQTYPSASSIGNGNFQVQYNSCDVASALNHLGGWQRVANAWGDNWPTY